MSINHFSSDITEALWWAQQKQSITEQTSRPSSSKHRSLPSQLHHHHRITPMFSGQNGALSFNLKQEDEEDLDEQLTDGREKIMTNEEQTDGFRRKQEIHKEPMFEKPLTPSDVGKLNRLVIPKQHAEKYFPLGRSADSGEKGLLLSFEDESGKSWRFRYSYWNSSQSYVLTKGWSRFVKEKRLDAGDIVMFERHPLDGDRLFIGCRRRTTTAVVQDHSSRGGLAQAVVLGPNGGGGGRGAAGWTRAFYPSPAHPYRSYPNVNGPTLLVPYQTDHCLHAGAGSVGEKERAAPSGNSKRLRLFGVNLECQPDREESEAPTTPDGSSMSSQSRAHPDQYHPSWAHDSNHHNHNHMDINFSGDINQMRYRRG